MFRKTTYILFLAFIIPMQTNTWAFPDAGTSLSSENEMSAFMPMQQNIELKEAIQNFNNGQFKKAIDLLHRLIVTHALSNIDYQTASEYLAVAYVSTNQDAKAEGVFTEILKQDPTYKPNDRWWPHKRLMASYYRTVKKVGHSLQLSGSSPGIKTIAIIDFENNSIEHAEKYANLGHALSKIIISDLSVLSKLKVVERERLQFIIDELKLTDQKVGGHAIISPESAPQLGKLLGAHSFVFGSFIQIGKTLRLDARLVKTETGEIFKTASVEGKPNEIFDLAKKLTIKITKNLDVDIEKTENKKLDKLGRSDVPIEAIALFGDAMSMANQEDYKDAYVKLERALSLAPDFEKAQSMLDVIKPLTL